MLQKFKTIQIFEGFGTRLNIIFILMKSKLVVMHTIHNYELSFHDKLRKSFIADLNVLSFTIQNYLMFVIEFICLSIL